MKTKITITITVANDNGLPQRDFTQEHEIAHDGAGQAIFSGVIAGLESVLSPIHRHYCPTPEEQENDHAPEAPRQ